MRFRGKAILGWPFCGVNPALLRAADNEKAPSEFFSEGAPYFNLLLPLIPNRNDLRLQCCWIYRNHDQRSGVINYIEDSIGGAEY